MHLDFWWRWRAALMSVTVGAIAALMRLPGLGYPTTLVFDEVFYARGAYSLMTMGYEGDWTGENQDFARGDLSGLETRADYVVHPMLGKLMIAVGMRALGPTPMGWRISGAVVGIFTVILVALIARHLFRSTIWGTMAGVLLAVEGQHVVLSRTALLDVFLTFFVVVGFGLLVADRARAQRMLLAKARADRFRLGTERGTRMPGLGPSTGFRWWRFAAMVSFGLAAGVKWSGLYFAAAFLILSVVWDLADRREAGYARWGVGALARAVPAGLLSVVTIPAVYLATWWPWFASESSYYRDWAAKNPGEGLHWLPESLRSLAHYHEQMYNFHKGLTSHHNYESHPNGWLIQLRPTAFHYETDNTVACVTDKCVSAIHAVGHPLIWLAMLVAFVYAMWRVMARHELLAATVTVGMLAAWLPWVPFAHRTIFTFYTVAMAPFIVLMVVWLARRVAQPEWRNGRWSRRGDLAVGGYVAAVLILAGFFAPIWTGQPTPYEYWQIHMWMPTWP